MNVKCGTKMVNNHKRKGLTTAVKAAVASGVIVAGGGSFSAVAFGDPWTEIARGIAEGIAEFTKRTFEQFTAWWEETQRENDKKVTIAKGRAEDSRLDFRVQVENLKRVNRVKPTTNLCDNEQESVQHNAAVEQEKISKIGAPLTRAPANAIIGTEGAKIPNRGVTYLGNQSGSFNLSKFLEEQGKIERKLAKKEPLTQAELGAYSKVTLGKTGADTLEPIRQIALQNEGFINNPNISAQVNAASVNAAAMTYATKVYAESINAESGSMIMLDRVERETLKMIGKRYSDEELKAELGEELNEVALTAEYLKLLGEHIYVMNSQFRLNQKIMAAMAMEIIVNDQDIA